MITLLPPGWSAAHAPARTPGTWDMRPSISPAELEAPTGNLDLSSARPVNTAFLVRTDHVTGPVGPVLNPGPVAVRTRRPWPGPGSAPGRRRPRSVPRFHPATG